VSASGDNGAPAAGRGTTPVPAVAPDRPDPEFEVLSVAPVSGAASPTLSFALRCSDASGRSVNTIALTSLITIEPAKRSYAEVERDRLVELFGEPSRWAATTDSFRWAQTYVLVPAFTGEATFQVPVACSYDLELAAGKYFAGLEDGEAPLRFHFNGSVFYEGDDGRMQVIPLPWDRSVRFGMPVSAWREMIAAHYPFRSWIPLDRSTVERLARLKADQGLPTFDAMVTELLDRPAGTER
jgi:hypothetical protein